MGNNYDKKIKKSGQKEFNNQKIKNYIIAKIEIKKGKLKQRIINSYENANREHKFILSDEIKGIENEHLIKKSDIYINNEKINFNYYYNFSKEGIYINKYIFKKPLISTNFMFYDCYSLKSIDLSNFNTQNVTNMALMFQNCNSLISIDLSNFNTQNVINMLGMFANCNSLKSINLSNFNTQNVINMSWMFLNCKSLISINLSNFNTQNVTNMAMMFQNCN